MGSARCMTSAVYTQKDRACSVGTIIFRSWRRASGKLSTVRPDTTRLEAALLASCSERLIRAADFTPFDRRRSEEHPSELQSLMRISYAVFCLKKKNIQII